MTSYSLKKKSVFPMLPAASEKISHKIDCLFCFVGNSFLGFAVPKLMASLHGQQMQNCSASALN